MPKIFLFKLLLMPMSFLSSIGTATPSGIFPQSTIADFMIRAMQLDVDDARKLRVVFRASGIDTRHSVIEDYGKRDQFKFYENTPALDPFPSTRRRLSLYQQHALSLSLEAVHACLGALPDFKKDSISHLLVVSCTGMYAPGLDIDLVKALGLNVSVQRTCINFMGCYAAFNALKLAHAIVGHQPEAKVLIVCTELCTIHFQKENTEDNMLANALFADGSAAALVEGQKQKGIQLAMENFYGELAFAGEHDMTWGIGDHGFEMRLSSYVPDIVRTGIRHLSRSLLAQMQLDLSDVDYYAIHPGGKRILEAIESELGLTREQNHAAYDVLRQFGNMSSPTVLFVLHSVWRSLQARDDGKRILSFAFGPGLTLESMLLKITCSS
jgi:prepilin-type processing-associated H-X9-DG protein